VTRATGQRSRSSRSAFRASRSSSSWGPRTRILQSRTQRTRLSRRCRRRARAPTLARCALGARQHRRAGGRRKRVQPDLRVEERGRRRRGAAATRLLREELGEPA